MARETHVPNYRYAVNRWPEATALTYLHNRIFGDSQSDVECVKSFLETVCVTILNELDAEVPVRPTTTELLTAVFPALGVVKPAGSSEVGKLLSGLNKIADAIQDVRNGNGLVAHGQDGFSERLEEDLLRAFIHAGDAVLGMLLRCYEGVVPSLRTTREPYENFLGYHRRIDRAVSVEVSLETDEEQTLVISLSMPNEDDSLVIRLAPSAILFGSDRPAYLTLLASAPVIPDSAGPATSSAGGALPAAPRTVSPDAAALDVDTYSGALDYLRGDVELSIGQLAGVEALGVAERRHLVESVLATLDANLVFDWQNRDSARALVRVALKRTFSRSKGLADNANDHSQLVLDQISRSWRDESALGSQR